MKFRKASLLMDLVISVMVMSMVLYAGFTLSSNSITRKLEISKEREALVIAENLMAETLSKGIYTISGVPSITVQQREEIANIENNTSISKSEKRKLLYNLPYYTPVTRDLAPNVSNFSDYKYHILVDKYVDEKGNPTNEMCKITIRVFYPIKVTKYDNSSSLSSSTDSEYNDDVVRDKSLKESDYRYVELYCYKTAKN